MRQQQEAGLVERDGARRPDAADETVLDAFRRWGYLEARLDPLGLVQPVAHAELGAQGEAAARARAWYCGPIGVEFMHIPDPARRRWVQERMEQPTPAVDTARVLERLVRADLFEEVLHGRYPGSKRFSLEGVTGLIPLLDEVLEEAAARGLDEALIGMSHRGRLNVMVHIVGRPVADVYAGFEDADPRSVLGSGDVKYHMGATGSYRTRAGRDVRVKLVSNPSHLEAVYPVALGRARARQVREGEGARRRIMPIILHGDAAFAGQGITAEALNFADLPGLHRRRHAPRRREQPARLHDARSRRPHSSRILDRRRAPPADPDLPRQRRGPAGRRPRRPAGRRVSLRLRQRRRRST